MTMPTEEEEAAAFAARLAAVVADVADALERAELAEAIDEHNARIDASAAVFVAWFVDDDAPDQKAVLVTRRRR